MRLGQRNDCLVILCVMIYHTLAGFGNMENAVEKICCPEGVQWQLGNCMA